VLDAAAALLAAWALLRVTGGCLLLATQSRESTPPGVDAAAPITSYRHRAEDLLQRRAARARPCGRVPTLLPCSRTTRDGQTLRADRRSPGLGDRRASAAGAREQLHSLCEGTFSSWAVPGHSHKASRAAFTLEAWTQ
jgi:hypothetical protein